ncbi:MAG: bifunctional diaminohydroxyphosphoribosylaminopyrimidine deaminase/5-amino-6-(5-phosphoribosylamino)uracil reductase RibD, partial [Actinomycetota bacterium]|nr:bifunctional diaminohydroxyphosphoribosylaminopyrimidine deaminase/5-amino-6-(5-phosphoribosylamino)uracil reductase RibD [Actinomycetota bacterium]
MSDEIYMQRALDLARSVARTSPNPRVGAVVVRDGVVLGEAAHEGAGHPHAEARALESIDARGATLFVTLEPCSHHGRRPPCAPAVVAAGVERVVAAMTDPDQRVSGRGFDLLRNSGVAVEVGLLEEEARRMNSAFVHHRSTGLPLVTIKLALTLDGRLAAPDGSSQWITDSGARTLVHRRRAEADAVLVGAGTIVADDPALTARDVDARRQPLRVIADGRGVVSPEARAISGAGEVIVATTSRCSHDRQTAYKEAGVEVVVLDEVEEGVDLRALLRHLERREITDVYCEGGAALATSLLRSGLAPRLDLFYGPLVVGAGGPALGDVGVTT